MARVCVSLSQVLHSPKAVEFTEELYVSPEPRVYTEAKDGVIEFAVSGSDHPIIVDVRVCVCRGSMAFWPSNCVRKSFFRSNAQLCDYCSLPRVYVRSEQFAAIETVDRSVIIHRVSHWCPFFSVRASANTERNTPSQHPLRLAPRATCCCAATTRGRRGRPSFGCRCTHAVWITWP